LLLFEKKISDTFRNFSIHDQIKISDNNLFSNNFKKRNLV